MAFDSFELQKAVYQRLTAQITDIKTFDHVPPPNTNVPSSDPQYYRDGDPYLRIDEITVTNADVKGTRLYDCDLTLSVFFRAIEGNKAVAAALKRMAAALDDLPDTLIMTGYLAIYCRFADQFSMQQGVPDDSYYHGVQRYKLLIQEM